MKEMEYSSLTFVKNIELSLVIIDCIMEYMHLKLTILNGLSQNILPMSDL